MQLRYPILADMALLLYAAYVVAKPANYPTGYYATQVLPVLEISGLPVLEVEGRKVLPQSATVSDLSIPAQYINASDGYQVQYGYRNVRALLPCLAPRTALNEQKFSTATLGDVMNIRIMAADSSHLTGERLFNARIAHYKNRAPTREEETSRGAIELSRNRGLIKLFSDQRPGYDIFVDDSYSNWFVLECARDYEDMIHIPYPHCSARILMNNNVMVEYEYSRYLIDDLRQNMYIIDDDVKSLIMTFFDKKYFNSSEECK